MKLFTRSVAVLALMALTLTPSLAANITIQVGDNFYRGPGNTTGSSDIRTINVGDVVTWNYVGQLSHPTASDNGAWPTFPMNSANTTHSMTFTTAGEYAYHCEVHGAPRVGMFGVLTVVAAPTATLNAHAAGITVNVYPNPTHGQITVQLNQKPGADYKLRLSNIIGQEIRTIALKPELTAAGLPLDLSDLHAGMYLYSLLVDGKVVTTKRLVLQN
ncbi:T9SS type A sorting domain-containing protein [Hymenobacter sp. BT770]|uniref:T9SS type A sorting domain-containing protein n=1 Tax=Hymenobacter sp. BT770 TaxID=2886942 RepID=UPI001D120082|nr:T9SS type A sorting domain-containing protein [Hymenobacter sp. BT770]MCC3153315.1 T9SS type A sorting domain-containing protein [Hymenobacter sp. BT770]MDO3414310.1 T9SS type A sorting domain-containing protein [Hymenobacter sp. BT770]